MKTLWTAGELLGHYKKKPIISIVGCGGKTTFMEALATETGRGKKVLMTTTTKIFPTQDEKISLCKTIEECESHVPTMGVQCFGLLKENSVKLESLPLPLLEKLTADYDMVLIESDGSAGFPLKGWTKTEPVIPSYSTHTLGIVTLDGLGKTVDENTVFRMAEFSKITGLYSGNIVDFKAIENMIFNKDGMFWNSVGERSLWVNKVESLEQMQVVSLWLGELKQKYLDFFQLIAYGSARKNVWERVV